MPSQSDKFSLTSLKGVGKKTAQSLEKAGYRSAHDLLWHLPRAYQDRSNPVPVVEAIPGSTATVKGQVLSSREKRYRSRRTLEIMVNDGTGVLVLKWFRFNKWLRESLEKRFPPGSTVVATGKIDLFAGHLEMHHPDLTDQAESDEAGIVPIYPLMEGLSQAAMRKVMKQVVILAGDAVTEPLGPEFLDKYGLPDLKTALQILHSPQSGTPVDRLNSGQTVWHDRLKFGELLAFQLGILHRKRTFSDLSGPEVKAEGALGDRLISSLTFSLTGAQQRSVSEILTDMSSRVPMHRLLQGDVGSGKTLVAFLAMLAVVEAGYQAIIMAPTEVLAEQHFSNMSRWAKEAGTNIGLLTGSTAPAERKRIASELADGSLSLLVGTHALIQEGVELSSLGLAVVDEQHRFGVMQRLALRKKGRSPHFLVMTATPIPRSLSLVLYGDLDISTIDELPPGRQPIITEIYSTSDRARLHLDVAREVSAGRQAYIVYPLVEESEKAQLLAANEMAENYRERIFPHLEVGLITGRMTQAEKEEVMDRFRRGIIQVLVATTVIEVGVDVPNATLMVVEHAERFGLFQLHQLRGRVGRGEYPSRCILVTGEKITEEARDRLGVMVRTDSGFVIAEEDLRIRGPGDFLGTRQAGMPDFRFAHPLVDRDMTALAGGAARELYPEGAQMPEKLKREVAKFWPEGYALTASG
jgi:ATP-dependent DNA helicase RecG